MMSDAIIYYQIEKNRWYTYLLSRSSAEPDLPRSHVFLPARDSSVVVPEFSERRSKSAEAIDLRGHGSRCCRPDPAASQHESENNENPCRTLQTRMTQHASEPNESFHRISNMSQPTWLRNHRTNNQKNKKKYRQLNKTKAPVPDQQSSTRRSPDAHIMAFLPLFMAVFAASDRGGGLR